MKIAIEGCCHGALDSIYTHISSLEAQHNYKVDLLLICGDFQAIRNERDLQCMAVPDKYKQLGEFWKYYTGVKKAPILTIVIGGNHEASSYFWELYHGGWIAPNIYFLGHAGCVQVNGIRIAGASGIFKPQDFNHGHWERLPYNAGSMRSIYHIREFNIRRLSLLSRTDIFLSHDWPQGIEHHGDVRGLLRRKPFFRQDIEKGELGSPPMMGLLHTLKPAWWFSAHLHCRFEATVTHEDVDAVSHHQSGGDSVDMVQVQEGTNPDEIDIRDIEDNGDGVERDVPVNLKEGSAVKPITSPSIQAPSTSSSSAVPFSSGRSSSHNPPPQESTLPVPAVIVRNDDEIVLDDEELEVSVPPPAPPPTTQASSTRITGRSLETKFLALDKCLPRRQFLEVVDVPIPIDFIPPDSSSDNIPVPGPDTAFASTSSTTPSNTPILSFDPEWLAITRAFQPYLSMIRGMIPFPDEAQAREAVRRELEWVRSNVIQAEHDGGEGGGSGTVRVVEDCQQFVMTAPPPGGDGASGRQQPPYYPNPQTAAFCSMLEIENKIDYRR